MKPVHISAIARKEFYHLIRDFRSLYLAFIIPLLLIVLFGYALSLDVNNIEAVVVDHDNTGLSRDFIRRLQASSYFKVVAYPGSQEEAVKILDHGEASLAVIIPPKWTATLRADHESPLQLIFDGSDPNFAGIARGYITSFVEAYNQERLFEYLNRQGLDKIDPPVDGRIRVWFNEDLESRRFIVPGIIAVIIIMVGAMLTSLVIAREYENGTMETIRSLPIKGVEFILGKAIPYFFIGLTDVLIAVFMGQTLFGIVIKSSFWLMVLASAIYLFVALSLGLLISITVKSQLVANQMAILLTYMPSFLLSNFVFPIENMPEVLRVVTRAVPATYFINILNGLYLRNLGMEYLWRDYLVLGGMFFIFSVATLFILIREGL